MGRFCVCVCVCVCGWFEYSPVSLPPSTFPETSWALVPHPNREVQIGGIQVNTHLHTHTHTHTHTHLEQQVECGEGWNDLIWRAFKVKNRLDWSDL